MRRFVPLLAILASALLSPALPAADAVAPAFAPSPRYESTAAELAAGKADPARQAERERVMTRAQELLKRGLVVPDKPGDWIFYYACPKDAARLTPKSPERHVCPTCSAEYTDARTCAAYRTLQYNDLERDMHDLALAYALSGDAEFATPVRDAFVKLAKARPTFKRHDRWGRTGLLAVVGGRRYAQHLDEAVSAILLAKTYDLIAAWPGLTADDRTLIARDFLEATVREIAQYEYFVDSSGKNNHLTWFNAAKAAVGLATGSAELVRDSLDGQFGLRFQLVHSVTADGLWYEGTLSYHFYALKAIMEQLDALKRAGIDLAGDARLKSLWTGPLQLAYPNGQVPALHDGDRASLANWGDSFAWGRGYFHDETLRPDAGTGALQSTALRDAGLAVLRRGSGDAAVCAIMDFGQHGGHHGHPDKLNLMLYGLGRELMPDPGRLSYSVPEYETWTRTTVAHNTVVINGANQAPDDGQLLFFDVTPEATACLARSTGAYPGVELRRFLLLTDTFLVDALEVVSTKPVTADWLAHVIGTPDADAGATALPDGALGKTNGYQHLRDLRQLASGVDSRVLAFLQPDKRALQIVFADDVASHLFSGTGIGYALTERVPFLLRRRENVTRTRFLTVYAFPAAAGGTVSAIRDPTPAGAPAAPPGSCGLRIGFGDQESWHVTFDLHPPEAAAGAPAVRSWAIER